MKDELMFGLMAIGVAALALTSLVTGSRVPWKREGLLWMFECALGMTFLPFFSLLFTACFLDAKTAQLYSSALMGVVLIVISIVQLARDGPLKIKDPERNYPGPKIFLAASIGYAIAGFIFDKGPNLFLFGWAILLAQVAVQPYHDVLCGPSNRGTTSED